GILVPTPNRGPPLSRLRTDTRHPDPDSAESFRARPRTRSRVPGQAHPCERGRPGDTCRDRPPPRRTPGRPPHRSRRGRPPPPLEPRLRSERALPPAGRIPCLAEAFPPPRPVPDRLP